MGWMRRHWLDMVLGLLFLTGMGLLLYPTVSNWWNMHYASVSIASYQEAILEMDRGDVEEMLASAKDWNASLVTDEARFFPDEADTALYHSLLSVPDVPPMGSISIPCIGVDLPLYHGTDDAVLATATGHLEGTSLPVPGETTHCAVAGHRGLPSAELFDRVPELEKGDLMCISVLDHKYWYKVMFQMTVLPEETSVLDFVPGKNLLSLVTCTPYGINTHRIIVTGELTDAPVKKAKETSYRFKPWQIGLFTLIGAFVLLYIAKRVYKYRKGKQA